MTIDASLNYVVVDLTFPDSPVYSFVDGAAVIGLMDNAHKNGLKIRVHPVAPAIIDWTDA